MNKITAIFLSFLFFLMPICAQEIELESDYVYMIDADNQQVLIDKGSDKLIYPASMTKIMTLIVVLEHLDDIYETLVLDKEVFQGLYEANASLAGYSLNEKVSVKDCLYGLFLPSGAECTKALAIHVAGSEDAFIELMNQKAKELGMKDTHYENTTGLHHIAHVTTLQDLSKLMLYCLNNPDFYEIFTTESYLATSGSIHNKLKMESTLFKRLSDEHKEYILGGKTGYTNPAGLCLASYASYQDRNVILITAHAPVSTTPYHVLDAVTAYSYIFESMHKLTLCDQDIPVKEVDVKYTLPQQTIQLYPSQTLQMTLPNDITEEDLKTVLLIDENIQAPLSSSQALGKLQLFYEGELLGTCDLEVREDVLQSDLLIFIDQAHTWFSNNWKICVLLAGCFLTILFWNKQRKS